MLLFYWFIFILQSAEYKNFNDWCFPNDYHKTYILTNHRQVYIGQSKDVIQRSKGHNTPSDYCKQFHFKRVYVICHDAFEETPAKNYEHLLIALMRADGKFEVVNRNDGENTHYQRKNMFELGFDLLWRKLEREGLVKEKHFHSVLNTGVYKYYPDAACLTPAQSEALTAIINAIDGGETAAKGKGFPTRPILVNGDAGTGKTVVAVALLYYLKTHAAYKNLRIALVYANPPSRNEIQDVLAKVPGLRKSDVIAPIDVTKQRFDILICDEAQRLRRNKNLGVYIRRFREGNARLSGCSCKDELDWLLYSTEKLVLFYDAKQRVCPSDIPEASFRMRLDETHCRQRPIVLREQMRIHAGDGYIPYIYGILHQEVREHISFQNYEFALFSDFAKMQAKLAEKEQTYHLCRLCSGYGWKWASKTDRENADICLDHCNVWWNRQTGGWLHNPEAKDEMGSIYSLSGLDLNYAGVVIGPELYYDTAGQKIKVDRAHYFDNKVKQGTGEENLKNYILHTYAVLMTRAIMGTYVYVCDPALRQYMSRFIPEAR